MASPRCHNRVVRGRANNKKGGKMGSRKKPGDGVLDMSVKISIVNELAKKAKRAGLGDEDLRHLATTEGGPLLDRFVDLMVQANDPFAPIKTVEVWKMSIDYSNKLKDWVEEWHQRGEGYLHPDITQSRFFGRLAGVANITLYLIHFDTYTLNIEALAEFTRRGINPAGIAELFALSTAFPKIQHRSPVVALGAVWNFKKEGPSAPMLTNDRCSGRSIVLGHGEPNYCWSGDTRFLAVRFW